MLSQIDDIPPESFCNGDNKPANCGRNCMCSHKVDIPMHAVVEVVLVDEGKYIIDILYSQRNFVPFLKPITFMIFSPTTKLESSIPFTWLLIQRHRYGKIAGQECQKNQLETRT